VRNTTGADLDAFAVVELTDTLESLTTDAAILSTLPAFDAITPTGADIPFGVLLDPIADDALGRCVVGGCAVAKVNIVDAGHEYAVPKSGDSVKFESAATGPVRIVSRESGSSGTKTAAVLISQPIGAVGLTVKESDGTPSYSNITSIEFDQADGFSLSQPGAGRVKVDFSGGGGGGSLGYANYSPSQTLGVPSPPGTTSTVTTGTTTYQTLASGADYLITVSLPGYIWLDATSPAGASAQIWVQLYDNTAAAVIGPKYLLMAADQPDQFTYGSGSFSYYYSPSTSVALRLQYTVICNGASGNAIINAAAVGNLTTVEGNLTVIQLA
jgi:hypothetical protein